MGIGIIGGQVGVDAFVLGPRWVSQIDLPEVSLEPLTRVVPIWI
jgi:hypothetical protein